MNDRRLYTPDIDHLMDLNLLPMSRYAGQDQSELTGLHIGIPPRGSARSRKSDRLISYFLLTGNVELAGEQEMQLFSRLDKTFFQTPGSVTAALRSAAESLNQSLLERNLRSANSGQQGIGLLAMLTLHGEQLYLAFCGPMHAFVIQDGGAHHLYDPDSESRGLGMGRATAIQYYQVGLSLNDTLLLTHRPPANWSEITLSGFHGQGPEGLRRKLLSQANSDISALVIQAKAGTGQVRLLQPGSLPEPLPSSPGLEDETAQTTSEPVKADRAAAASLASLAVKTPAETTRESYPDAGLEASPPPSPFEATEEDLQDVSSGTPEHPADLHTQESAPALPKPSRKPARLSLVLGRFFSWLLNSGQILLRRMLPGEGTLPASVMAFIAIAVPLMVVSVAMVVYFQRGRTSEYQAYYAKAVEAAQQAQSQTDPQQRFTAWEGVVNSLDKAEAYQTTGESKALRAQAQDVLDELGGVKRLDYQLAIAGGLPGSDKITRLAATDSDLYLLNASDGIVKRALLTGQGYELDDKFQCGPSTAPGQTMGPVVDMAALPKGSGEKASILAMDIDGNIMECGPGQPPVLSPLAPPTTKPKAFTLDQGNLYVLDPINKRISVYWNSDFTKPADTLLSGEDSLFKDAVDLAVDKSDLYLLHADGHNTLCTISNFGVSPNRCSDVPYIDSRPGSQGKPMSPIPAFSQIRSTQPPEPSLYLLDPQSQAIDHFSLRLLTFQRQLRSQNPFPSGAPATAFALRPDGQVVFLALGNLVYYAGLP